jgi:PII-like signaling protein
VNAPIRLLLIFVNEADMVNNRPLYQTIVERLHQLEIAGATATAGLMGFGHHQRVHHKGLFGISDDRPSRSSLSTKKRGCGRSCPRSAGWSAKD